MKWSVYFLILIRHTDRDAVEKICSRFEIAPRYRKIFITERFRAEDTLNYMERHLPMKNSDIYRHLKEFRTEVLLYMMAVARHEKTKKAISHFVTDLQYVQVSVTGKDIKHLGIQPSPLYGEIFRALLAEKMDGRLHTHDDEIEFIKTYANR